MSQQGRFDRFRQWLAGKVFLLAGRIHRSYDVWLDNAEPRQRADESGTVTEAGCSTPDLHRVALCGCSATPMRLPPLASVRDWAACAVCGVPRPERPDYSDRPPAPPGPWTCVKHRGLR